MLLHQHEHGTLPPAYTADAAGKPLQSWRVLLLPYSGEEELFAQIRLDEPWDSQHNSQFHDAASAFDQCPSAGLVPGQTTYSVVVGRRTAFGPAQGSDVQNSKLAEVDSSHRSEPCSANFEFCTSEPDPRKA